MSRGSMRDSLARVIAVVVLLGAVAVRAQALAGTYDVGMGRTYASPSAAVADLIARGQSGPVAFNVFAGSYPAAVLLTGIAGNSATNTITLRKAAAAGGVVSVGSMSVSGTFAVTLEGFDTLSGTVTISNGARSTTIRNVTFPSSSTAVALVGTGNHDTVLTQLRVDSQPRGEAVTVSAAGNDNLVIERCAFSSLDGSSVLRASWPVVAGTSTAGWRIENNVAAGYTNSFIISAPGLTGVARHNSVRANGPALYLNDGQLSWRNNIIVLSTTVASNSPIIASAGAVPDTDWNLYFTADRSASIATRSNVAYRSLAAWQLATGADTNSLVADPRFVSSTAFHLGQNSPAEGRGTASSVTSDFEGNPRATPPDLGALESAQAAAPPLAGVYEVGAGRTYLSLASATAELMRRGQSAPVVFDLFDGEYVGVLQLKGIAGNSAVNSVTIRKAAAATGSVAVGAIELNGVRGVSLVGMNRVDGPVTLVNGASSATLRNDTFASPGEAIALLSGGNHDLSISQSSFTPSLYGESVRVLSAGNDNLAIERCSFVGPNDGNYPSTAVRAAWSGSGATGWRIENNLVTGTSTGFDLSAPGLAGVARHNTVVAPGRAVLQLAGQLTWRNNIFVTTRSGSPIFQAASPPDSDWNLYFPAAPSARVGTLNVTDHRSLAAWQLATGAEANSLLADPRFTSQTDLHLLRNSPALGRGTALGVATDVDGEPRPSPPDLGADESTLVPEPPMTGVYPVGGGASFSSIATAVSELIARGQSGPVLFDVSADASSTSLQLKSVAGNSTSNTVTIRKASTATSPVSLGGLELNGVQGVSVIGFDRIDGPVTLLNGARSTTLRGLSFTAQAGVQLLGGGNHDLLVTQSRFTTASRGVAVDVTVPGNLNLVVERSSFFGPDAASVLRAAWGATAVPTTGWRFENNFVVGYTNAFVFDAPNLTGNARHNSVLAAGPVVYETGNGRLSWRNNILGSSSLVSPTPIFSLANSSVPDADWNLYDLAAPGVLVGRRDQTLYSSLSAWQAVTGTDTNSLVADPSFTSATDLHLLPSSPAQGRGLASSVVTDIDGETRQAPPDLGADEDVRGVPVALAMGTQPNTTLVAGVTIPDVTVAAVDGFGTVVPGFRGPISIALESDAGAALFGAATVTADGGVGVFSGLRIEQAGQAYAFRFDSVGLTPTSSRPFDVLPSSPTKLALRTQPRNTLVGAPLAPVVVEVHDTFGNRVPSATAPISMTLSMNPSGATLSGGSQTAPSNGLVTFSSLSVDRVGSGYALTAAAAGLTAATSNPFDIAAEQLVFDVQPANRLAGELVPVAVSVRGVTGQLDVGRSDVVTLVIEQAPAGATLMGTVSAPADGGVAQLGNWWAERAGSWVLRAQSPNTADAVSAPFTVSAAAPATLAFGSQPSNTTAGQTIAPAVSVEVRDRFGNVTSTSSAVALELAPNSQSATLSGTIALAADGGIARFSALTVTRAGSAYTLVASSAGLGSSSSLPFDVAAAAPQRLVFTRQPLSVLVGAPLAVEVTVNDGFGNVAESTEFVSLSLVGADGGTLGGALSRQPSGGRVAFDGVSVDAVGQGFQLVAAAPGLVEGLSDAFDVSERQLVFSSFPAQFQAGVPAKIDVELRSADGARLFDSGEVVRLSLLEADGTTSELTTAVLDQGAATVTVSLAAGVGLRLVASANRVGTARSPPFDVIDTVTATERRHLTVGCGCGAIPVGPLVLLLLLGLRARRSARR